VKNICKKNITARAKHSAKSEAADPSKAFDYSLAYAAEGIKVIWIPTQTKAPVEKNWPSLATTDAATINGWDAAHPGCNFGLVMRRQRSRSYRIAHAALVHGREPPNPCPAPIQRYQL
jgi:hypothetical protein